MERRGCQLRERPCRRVRARSAPPLLRGLAFFAWRKRWMRMLSVSCGRSFGSSLVSPRADALDGKDGFAPDLADLFAEG